MKAVLVTALVLAAGIAALVLLPATRKREFKSIEEMMAYSRTEAVRLAHDLHATDLDYSLESVKKVDVILGKIHEEFVRQQPKEGARGLALMFGAYLGECIRRQTGEGRWERDHPKAGEGSLPFYWKKGASFPVAWCLKRIQNGEQDSVWVKYQHFVLGEVSEGLRTPEKPNQ